MNFGGLKIFKRDLHLVAPPIGIFFFRSLDAEKSELSDEINSESGLDWEKVEKSVFPQNVDFLGISLLYIYMNMDSCCSIFNFLSNGTKIVQFHDLSKISMDPLAWTVFLSFWMVI